MGVLPTFTPLKKAEVSFRGRKHPVPLRAFQVRAGFFSPYTPSFDLEAALVVPALPKGCPFGNPDGVLRRLQAGVTIQAPKRFF